MGEVSVTLNGRTYQLECDDGEEKHLLNLAETVGERIENLKTKFGQIGDDRLMLMAGLMIADDLAETQNRLKEANAELESVRENSASTDELIESARAEVASRIGAAADRIEALNAVLGAENSDGGDEQERET